MYEVPIFVNQITYIVVAGNLVPATCSTNSNWFELKGLCPTDLPPQMVFVCVTCPCDQMRLPQGFQRSREHGHKITGIGNKGTKGK